MKKGMVVLLCVFFAFAALANQDDTAVLGQDKIQQNIKSISPQDREIDEFGNLHDPVLMLQFDEGPQNHTFGIAWDGQYYWTINGGNSTGLLNRFDENGNYLGVTNVSIDGRGIVFNPIDELLYISSYQGNIYRIDDPFADDATTMVGTGIMQNGQASFGMSWDGTLLYDFFQGVTEVHDFFTFDLLDSYTGFSYGVGNFGGECSIIADTDYLYTINAGANELFVYNISDGNYVDTFVLPFGDNGLSLSIANNLIFYNDDSSYDIGTWYGYSLRDWTDGPVTLTLTGTTTTVPAIGGDVVYDVHLVSTIGLALNGLDYETYVTLPNSQVFGPLVSIPWNLTPFMDVTVVGMTQNIPDYAPQGNYYFEGRAGILSNPALTLTDSFPFTKMGAAADVEIVFNPEDWVASGSFVTGDNADVVAIPTQFEMQTAYPNPFNPSTSVAIVLPSASDLTVTVFNVMGQQVATLANGRYNAGQHSFVFDAANLSSGLYFIQAQVPGELNAIQKVTLMK